LTKVTSRMSLPYWAFSFVYGCRFEASKLRKEDMEFFEPYTKENMLGRPCTVEILQFSNPFSVVFLFFFDPTWPDLAIHTSREKWVNLNRIVESLLKKYCSLLVHHKDLRRMLDSCRRLQENCDYGIDLTKNVCCLYFRRDPREKQTPSPKKFDSLNDPQEIASIILERNLSQSSIYFDQHSL
jgi:hypothetical protein